MGVTRKQKRLIEESTTLESGGDSGGAYCAGRRAYDVMNLYLNKERHDRLSAQCATYLEQIPLSQHVYEHGGIAREDLITEYNRVLESQ
jgi:hypothetical protein|tara:strand:- start:2751 stop:3017 length:267 start_codon:yes stop_codon:yes gene_type:complete